LAALNHGRSYWPSEVMRDVIGVDIANQFKGRDPLAEAIDAGLAHNIRVFAWLEFGFASHHGSLGQTTTLLSAQPQWAALNRQGQPVVKNQFHWMNAFDPEVQAWMTRLCLELVRRYPGLAGIQGDDRLPALPVEAGHNPGLLAAYANAHGGNAPPAADKDLAWTQWRADLLTEYLRTLRTALKAAKPSTTLSIAPSAQTFGFREYLQDWPKWLRQGLCDELIPQLYRRDAQAYERLLKQHTHIINSNWPVTGAGGINIAAGVLYSLGQEVVASPQLLAQYRDLNRQHGWRGEVLFHSVGV
jgi:uncharacterized lipoprotein YddW (UPF0748 family)